MRVHWLDDPLYFQGAIDLVNADGTFDIVFDNEDKEKSVPPDRIYPIGDLSEPTCFSKWPTKSDPRVYLRETVCFLSRTVVSVENLSSLY